MHISKVTHIAALCGMLAVSGIVAAQTPPAEEKSVGRQVVDTADAIKDVVDMPHEFSKTAKQTGEILSELTGDKKLNEAGKKITKAVGDDIAKSKVLKKVIGKTGTAGAAIGVASQVVGGYDESGAMGAVKEGVKAGAAIGAGVACTPIGGALGATVCSSGTQYILDTVDETAAINRKTAELESELAEAKRRNEARCKDPDTVFDRPESEWFDKNCRHLDIQSRESETDTGDDFSGSFSIGGDDLLNEMQQSQRQDEARKDRTVVNQAQLTAQGEANKTQWHKQRTEAENRVAVSNAAKAQQDMVDMQSAFTDISRSIKAYERQSNHQPVPAKTYATTSPSIAPWEMPGECNKIVGLINENDPDDTYRRIEAFADDDPSASTQSLKCAEALRAMSINH